MERRVSMPGEMVYGSVRRVYYTIHGCISECMRGMLTMALVAAIDANGDLYQWGAGFFHEPANHPLDHLQTGPIDVDLHASPVTSSTRTSEPTSETDARLDALPPALATAPRRTLSGRPLVDATLTNDYVFVLDQKVPLGPWRCHFDRMRWGLWSDVCVCVCCVGSCLCSPGERQGAASVRCAVTRGPPSRHLVVPHGAACVGRWRGCGPCGGNDVSAPRRHSRTVRHQMRPLPLPIDH